MGLATLIASTQIKNQLEEENTVVTMAEERLINELEQLRLTKGLDEKEVTQLLNLKIRKIKSNKFRAINELEAMGITELTTARLKEMEEEMEEEINRLKVETNTVCFVAAYVTSYEKHQIFAIRNAEVKEYFSIIGEAIIDGPLDCKLTQDQYKELQTTPQILFRGKKLISSRFANFSKVVLTDKHGERIEKII